MTFWEFGNRAAIAAAVTVMITGLQGCGGGGGGGTKTLTVNFDYPNKLANLWQPTTLDISATGLEGYPPVCTVLTGALPKGLAIESGSCRISGTPTEATIVVPTIRLTVPGATGQVDQEVRLVVQGPSADYTGLGGTVHLGVPYTFTTYSAEGKNAWAPLPGQAMRYAITSGALPHGLALDAASGKISGIPDQTGYSTFTIQAQASAGASVASSPVRSYNVSAELPAIGVSYPELAEKRVGETISLQPTVFYPTDVQADKVTLSYQLPRGESLPPGLSLDPVTGIVSGTLTGPVPGQAAGVTTSWPYVTQLAITVTIGKVSYTTRPTSNLFISVLP